MTDSGLAPAVLWNIAESVFFLCTSEYRAIPDGSGRTLNELITDYEDRRFWSRIRSVADAIADLNLFVVRGELEEQTIEPSEDPKNDQLGLLEYFEAELIDQVLRMAFFAHELQPLLGRLPSSHTTAEEAADSFDIVMANRPWLQLHEAVRFVLLGFPNGRKLNAFVRGPDWKTQNHPVWLTAYAGVVGEELFEQAQACWRQSEEAILDMLRKNDVVAVSHGQQIPASLWQDYSAQWWESALYPSPLARNEGLTLPPLGVPVFGNILVEKRQLEALKFAVARPISGSKIVPGTSKQSKGRPVAEAEFYRVANRVVELWKGERPPTQGEFEKALRTELTNAIIPRDRWRKFWHDTYHPDDLPKRGRRANSHL